MRVLINAASAGLGGALTYITNLLRELPGVAVPGDQFFAIVPELKVSVFDKVVDHKMTELIPYAPTHPTTLRRLYFDNWTIPRIARELDADVLFSSTGLATLRSPCPQVLLVRNAAYFCPVFERKYKEINAPFLSIWGRRSMSFLSMRAADIVVFPSQAMLENVASHVSITKKHMAILSYGFSSDRFFQGGTAKPAIADKMERWRDAGYRILLNVSHYAVHKNFETLIESLATVIASGVKIKFVCTLSNRTQSADTFTRESNKFYVLQYDSLLTRERELGISGAVVHAGDFDHAQLHYLYERADVFVFPSFTESFGHPLVEAMSCGLPIVASDTAVNRELCGEAARYFDTFDPVSCASALESTLRDADLRGAMQAKGLERSKDFSWTNHTASLLDLLRDVCV